MNVTKTSILYIGILDPLAVADICENGILNPSEDIEGYLLEPLSINKDQKYSKYNPYDHIYVSYNDDPRLEPLWKCADGLNHPFSSTSRIKLLMTIITSYDTARLDWALACP